MTTQDPFANYGTGLDSPGQDAFAVTPSDTVSFTVAARALYIGSTGDVTLLTRLGTVVTFVGVLAGTILPVRCTRVNAASTTASNIVGIY